jgi:hypothetical protein
MPLGGHPAFPVILESSTLWFPVVGVALPIKVLLTLGIGVITLGAVPLSLDLLLIISVPLFVRLDNISARDIPNCAYIF